MFRCSNCNAPFPSVEACLIHKLNCKFRAPKSRPKRRTQYRCECGNPIPPERRCLAVGHPNFACDRCLAADALRTARTRKPRRQRPDAFPDIRRGATAFLKTRGLA